MGLFGHFIFRCIPFMAIELKIVKQSDDIVNAPNTSNFSNKLKNIDLSFGTLYA